MDSILAKGEEGGGLLGDCDSAGEVVVEEEDILSSRGMGWGLDD